MPATTFSLSPISVSVSWGKSLRKENLLLSVQCQEKSPKGLHLSKAQVQLSLGHNCIPVFQPSHQAIHSMWERASRQPWNVLLCQSFIASFSHNLSFFLLLLCQIVIPHSSLPLWTALFVSYLLCSLLQTGFCFQSSSTSISFKHFAFPSSRIPLYQLPDQTPGVSGEHSQAHNVVLGAVLCRAKSCTLMVLMGLS